MDPYEKLFSGFPPVTVEQWEAKIREDLKGADYDKKLIRKTLDSISIKPYYRAENLEQLKYLEQASGVFPFVRGNKKTRNDWEIRQDITVTHVKSAVEKAIGATSRGITSVGYDLTNKGDLHSDDLKKLITGIDCSRVTFNFITGDTAVRVLDYILKAVEQLKMNKSEFKGSVEYDPLGHLVASGSYYRSQKEDMVDAGNLLGRVKGELPGVRVLAVNSHVFSDTGASVVQELAYGLSMISEYISALTEQGFSLAEIVKHFQWNMGVGSDYFMEIARIRAARLLFSGLVSGFDSTREITQPVYVHSVTTRWNKTLYDPHVNLLRLTTEAMSAILGGCNSLQVLPFDTVYNDPTDFSERLARNIQTILKEESYFDRVIDPAAGSYYIETLTDALVENVWKKFLEIEGQGGFIKLVLSGSINEEVKNTAQRRIELIASRREVLLGTNQFPNINETINGCIAETIAFPGCETVAEKVAEPLIRKRASEEFEKLRLAVERNQGKRPRVFMLTYGNLAMRLARSQFSGNFFACAGYEIVDNLGFFSAAEGVNAAMEAKADIIVVCSSDDEYLEIAPAVAELVNNKAIVVVAGAPACMEELKQKGIQDFIHIRSNVLETLKGFHKKLGIEIK
jgi:methylmalonyl-CoA mutase